MMMNKEYNEEIGGIVIKIGAENSGSLNPIQQESVLEKEATKKTNWQVPSWGSYGAKKTLKFAAICNNLAMKSQ